jgi:hypothetical protein
MMIMIFLPLHIIYNDLPIPDTKIWIEFIQNYPFPREKLIIKVKTLIDEIQLLKGYYDISKGFVYNT